MSYQLEYMQDAERAQERILAWFEGQVLDRAPIRFTEHNASHNVDLSAILSNYASLKDYWFDTDYHIHAVLDLYKKQPALAETFPVYFPNLGPGVYASYYGAELEFAPVTSWTKHVVDDIATFDAELLQLDRECENWKKIESMTGRALELCAGKVLVGYTDLHPSLDCVADWCGTEQLCFALYDEPDRVKALADKAYMDFPAVYGQYCEKLMAEGMPCVTWMGIPAPGRMHIPSCDFSTMISEDQFERFALPYILQETALADYNIFHLDGPGVARHLKTLLEIPSIQAIQVVQGVAEDEPIMQWVPMIREIQAAGKSAVLGIQLSELDELMGALRPEGIFLTLACDYDVQPDVVKKVAQWK